MGGFVVVVIERAMMLFGLFSSVCSLFLFTAQPLFANDNPSPNAAAPTLPDANPSRPGVFVSPDLGTMYLSHDEDRDEWYLTEQGPEGEVSVYRLEREQDRFRPVTWGFKNADGMMIFADGDRIYGSDGDRAFRVNLAKDETVLSEGGKVVDGSSSAGAIELSVMAREFSSLWRRMREASWEPGQGIAGTGPTRGLGETPSLTRVRDLEPVDAEFVSGTMRQHMAWAGNARRLERELGR